MFSKAVVGKSNDDADTTTSGDVDDNATTVVSSKKRLSGASSPAAHLPLSLGGSKVADGTHYSCWASAPPSGACADVLASCGGVVLEAGVNVIDLLKASVVTNDDAAAAVPPATSAARGGDDAASSTVVSAVADAPAVPSGVCVLDEDPVCVVDLGCVARKVEDWNRLLPRVTPHYAVKCNPNPVVLRTLKALGVGFDCASKGEIHTVLSLDDDDTTTTTTAGSTPTAAGGGGGGEAVPSIVYSNPCKAPSHIRHARDAGVDLLTFDNEAELVKIKAHHPGARLLVRMITDDSHSLCQFSTKYGADGTDIRTLLALCRTLELDCVGVSFHVGSGCQDVSSFKKALHAARAVFDTAALPEYGGFDFTVLDIGGGFPGNDCQVAVDFCAIAMQVGPLIDSLWPDTEKVKVIAEPGRYLATACHTIAVNVHSIRQVRGGGGQPVPLDAVGAGASAVDANPAAKVSSAATELPAASPSPSAAAAGQLLYVNDGCYGYFNSIIYDYQVVVPRCLQPRDGPLRRCTIFGPTCDSLDCLNKDVQMPPVEVGDWLYFEDMGAYTYAAATNFNGFAYPRLCYVWTHEH